MRLPIVTKTIGLTGKRRYRVGWFNKVILQVEVEMENINILFPSNHPRKKVRWTTYRDAAPHEIGIPERVSGGVFMHIKDGQAFEVNKKGTNEQHR